MSCVDVPRQPSPHHQSPASSITESNGNGRPLVAGGTVPPTKLNPLASDYDPGINVNGARQQAQEAGSSQGGRGGRGAGRGGGGGGRGGGRGGLSSAMSRSGQQGGQQQQQQQQSQAPARQGSGGASSAPGDAGGGGGGSSGGGSAPRGGGGGGAAAAVGGRTGGVTNANHLLNFQYESARGGGGRGGGGRGGGRSGGSRGGFGGGGSSAAGPARRYGTAYGSKPQKYDKNKFLQANFRFLVSDAVDVSAYEADADKMFDWEDVLQVEMSSAAPVQCPISLDSPPLCPQITPCGHVFSFPAIMHHLVNHGGEQLRRSAPCPLCFAPLVARELRLVRVRRAACPAPGAALTLALIRRTRTSIIPQPVDPGAAAAAAAAAEGGGGGGGGGGGEPRSRFDANPFAKFVVGGDAGELWRAAAQQLAACAMQLVSEGGADAALEAPFVYGALEALAARARRWAEHRGELLAARGLLAAREGPGAEPAALGAAAEAAVKQMFTAAVSDAGAAAAAAAQRAAIEEQFPALPPAAAATSAATAANPQRSARSNGSGGGGGGKSAAPGGSIAASVPPASAAAAGAEGGGAGGAAAAGLAASAAEAGPSEPSAPFDAMFTMDEQQDEQPPAAAAPEEPAAGGRRRSSGDAAAAAAAALSTSVGGGGAAAAASGGGSSGLLGSSPGSSVLNTPGVAGEFYTYQAADGSWLFLHPLNLRCLLSHYGSYDACPPVITARLLELEDVVQADAVRRRWRFLSHLPLGGAFKLCELAVAELLPPEALAPYSDELAARLGPSAEELQAMPALSQAVGGAAAAAGDGGSGSGVVAAAGAAAAALAREMALSPSEVAESIALQASLEEAAAAAAAAAAASPGAAAGGGGGGVSFAHITKMGFAATGPALGSSPPLGAAALAAPAGAWGARAGGAAAGGGGGAAAAAGPPALLSPSSSSPWSGIPAAGPSPGLGGAWGGGRGGATIKAAAAAPPLAAPGKGAEAEGGAGGGKKGKGGKGTLLFSLGQQRKY